MPTDDQLLAAIDRGITAGQLTVVDETYLARLDAEIHATPCGDEPGMCGAPAGKPCDPGCPTHATDRDA